MSVRVLIVDELVMFRDELRHHLQCIGCEIVAEAANTFQALVLFRTVAPSLVILDIGVPQTGGIGALALLRIMRSENPLVQVLVSSLLALPEVRKSFLLEGAFDYLIKPSIGSFEHLRERLEKLFPELLPMPELPTQIRTPLDSHHPQP